jgi:cytochrome b pre-mRNA-processing protein 3
VAQARLPAFYAECGIEDTAEGHYEMIVLHLVLVLERLGREGEAGASLARQLVEAFVRDMDDSMREMGVGDMGVGKRVKRAAAGVYERGTAYAPALRGEEGPELTGALEARLPGLAGHGPAGAAVTRYVRAAGRHLSAIPGVELLGGRVTFPRFEPGLGTVRGQP